MVGMLVILSDGGMVSDGDSGEWLWVMVGMWSDGERVSDGGMVSDGDNGGWLRVMVSNGA